LTVDSFFLLRPRFVLLEPSPALSESSAVAPVWLRVFFVCLDEEADGALEEEALVELPFPLVAEDSAFDALVEVRDLFADFDLELVLVEEVAGVSSRSELWGLLSITEG
jgi:hypothetical protein